MSDKLQSRKFKRLLLKVDRMLRNLPAKEIEKLFNDYQEIYGLSKVKFNAEYIEIIASEVMQKKWGEGAERKLNLTEAGYNYNDIQNRVNSMTKELVEQIKEKEREIEKSYKYNKIVDMEAVHHYGDKWTTELIVALMRKYMRSRDNITGRYDPDVKSKIYRQYGISEDSSISNKINSFINDALYKGDKWKLISDGYFTKEELVKWKWKDKKVLKMCIDNGSIPDDELSIMKGCIK